MNSFVLLYIPFLRIVAAHEDEFDEIISVVTVDYFARPTTRTSIVAVPMSAADHMSASLLQEFPLLARLAESRLSI
jgi:hypothetical protein